MIVDNLYNSIERGKQGLNSGLSTSLPKLDKLIYGIQRKWLTVAAGDSGSGKTSFVLYTQVFQTFQQYMRNPELDIHYLLFIHEITSNNNRSAHLNLQAIVLTLHNSAKHVS